MAEGVYQLDRDGHVDVAGRLHDLDPVGAELDDAADPHLAGAHLRAVDGDARVTERLELEPSVATVERRLVHRDAGIGEVDLVVGTAVEAQRLAGHLMIAAGDAAAAASGQIADLDFHGGPTNRRRRR